MDHDRIDRHQVVERYLQGTLSAGETAAFEEHYLHCKRCVDELEAAEKLRRGLKRVVAENAAVAVTVQRPGILANLARLRRWQQAAVVGLGALAILAIPSGVFLDKSRRLDEASTALAAAREPQVNTAILRLSPGRGSARTEPAVRVRVPEEPAMMVFSIELDDAEFERYSLSLRSEDGREIWATDELRPDHLDALVFSLHSSFLEAGDYSLRVEGISSETDRVPVAELSFRALP